MELTVTLEIKPYAYEFKGRTVKALNAYVNGEYLTGVGFVTEPFLEQALIELAKETAIEGISNVKLKIKTPKKLPLQVQSELYHKYMYDGLFKDITFLT